MGPMYGMPREELILLRKTLTGLAKAPLRHLFFLCENQGAAYDSVWSVRL